MSDRMFARRSKLLRFFLFALMVSLIMRLLYIQVVHAGNLEEQAQDWIKADKDVLGTRGTIYDSTGERKLAFTGIAYDINVDLSKFREEDAKAKGDTPEEYAKFLSPLLNMSIPELLTYLDPTKKTTDGKPLMGTGLGPKSKKVDSSVNDQIKKMRDEGKFSGITTIPVDVRRYPNGEFASHVLGYFGMSDKSDSEKGLAGVEFTYNEALTGKPGKVEYYTDRDGNPLPTYPPEPKVPAVDGEDMVLTIDSTIQQYVEDELNAIVEKYAPKHASIIVVDPNNGEVKALGNRPAYNPNTYAKTEPASALWDNWALQAFEPGSTFKVFVLSAALAEHKVNLNETFPSGRIQVGSDTIYDWNRTGFGTITYRQGVYNSSNVGFVKIGQKLGKDTLYDYISRYGFDKRTGIDLPGEGSSYLFDPNNMRDIDLASTSFGQGISVTPIQQVAAMMAIANGGTVYQPRLVKEFRNQETGETTRQIKPKVLYEVGDEETYSTVRQVLEETVTNDAKGYIKGYHVAGKTGTAQVPKKDGAGYEDDLYRLSFIGFAPADKPKLLIYVTVDQATKNAPFQYGSYVAEPSAKIVLENSLRYMQVPIDETDLGLDKNGKKIDPKQAPADGQPKPPEPTTFVNVPDFIGSTPEQADELSQKSSLQLEKVGDGPKVTGQWPDTKYGQVPAGSEVKLYFGPEGSQDGKVKVPDLRGQSFREAMETLQLLQLDIAPTGNGYVIKQETPPGTLVPFGTPIQLELAPQS